MKTKEKNISIIYKICQECYGYGDGFSFCCNEEVDNGKCTYCGKFCKSYPCSECDGFAEWDIKVGYVVEIFVYKNSPDYLKKQFKNGRYGKGKTYRGVVNKLINSDTIRVKLSNRIVDVKIDDVDIC